MSFYVKGVKLGCSLTRKRMNCTATIHTAHYQCIVVGLNETVRLMAEIDRVIETHGGWPGAFQSGPSQGNV